MESLHEPRSKKEPKNLVSCYRKYVKYYNFDMLKFPVAIKAISKFENKNNVSINVYGLEETKHGEYHNDKSDTKINNNKDTGIIYPLKVSKK